MLEDPLGKIFFVRLRHDVSIEEPAVSQKVSFISLH